MADDVVPALLRQIKKSFNAAVKADRELITLNRSIRAGAADYKMAYRYAELLSKHCSDAILQHCTAQNLPNETMYYNIASRIIKPMLTQTYRNVAQMSSAVQQAINDKLGLQLDAITPDVNSDRLDGIAVSLANFENLDEVRRAIDDDVLNYNLHCIDETIKVNASFQHQLGIRAIVRRECHGKACSWCEGLEGVFDYAEIKDGSQVWARHRGCQCTLTYEGDTTRIVWGNGDRFKWQSKDRTINSEIRRGLRDANGRRRRGR